MPTYLELFEAQYAKIREKYERYRPTEYEWPTAAELWERLPVVIESVEGLPAELAPTSALSVQRVLAVARSSPIAATLIERYADLIEAEGHGALKHVAALYYLTCAAREST